MQNIKQQFEDFRSETPKHVQWLLLGVAFLVVIILLILLFSHKKTEEPVPQNPEVKVTPVNVAFDNIKVGTQSSNSVIVSTDIPAVISDISIKETDFSVPSLCEGTLYDTCDINIIYKPSRAATKTETTLVISWQLQDEEEASRTIEIPVTYSAYEEKKVEVVKPAPVQEPEEPEEEYDFEDDEEYEDEIDPVVLPNPFVAPEPEAVSQPVSTPIPPKKCSEFAFPGYDMSGRQIGWIKPERGAYYFYPLSDKTCSKATGRYDFNTGYITSLSDGSKIGTDSDHIGYKNVKKRDFALPKLGSDTEKTSNVAVMKNGYFDNAIWESGSASGQGGPKKHEKWGGATEFDPETLKGSGAGESVIASKPYDRTFILRQFKPIPATIVSEVRADPSVYGCAGKAAGADCDPKKNYSVPVRATVDRNVYSDDGRTVILPTGTLLMGYLDGDLPGPYQTFGRMNIKWYQFIRPDGVEFNFQGEGTQDPYSADAQGRMGVPGHGSTDYIEQMVMPILTALVPAAVNMIAPITDTVINQIDLDNNTIVQSGTIRSSEMAKQDIINTWNKITQKLLVDAIDNTVPPFSIAAGTRINVFSPVDLIVSCEGEKGMEDKKCAVITRGEKADSRRPWSKLKEQVTQTANDNSWVGQVRSFNLFKYCDCTQDKCTLDQNSGWEKTGYDYRTVLLYCESQTYQAINNAKQAVYYDNVKQQAANNYGTFKFQQINEQGQMELQTGQDADKQKLYNTEVLGLQYDEDGEGDNILNPFGNSQQVDDSLYCENGGKLDEHRCCPGETYTYMGEGYIDENGNDHACCPDDGGGCFPPVP